MSTNSILQVRQISCARCGVKINIHTGLRMKTFVCNYCGSVCENNQVVAVQNQQEIKGKYAPQRYLKLGVKGNFPGQQYKIVGRICYESSDDEDTWIWDEWFLMSPTGELLWIQEDETGFTLLNKFVPNESFDPAALDNPIFINNESFDLVTTGFSKIVFLEGEFIWKVKPKELNTYIEYSNKKQLFLAEYTASEKRYFIGKKLTNEELKQAFEQIAENTLSSHQTDKKRIDFIQIGIWFLIFGFIGLFLESFFSETGQKIFQGTAKLKINEIENEYDFVDISGKPRILELDQDTIVKFIFKSGNFFYNRTLEKKQIKKPVGGYK